MALESAIINGDKLWHIDMMNMSNISLQKWFYKRSFFQTVNIKIAKCIAKLFKRRGLGPKQTIYHCDVYLSMDYNTNTNESSKVRGKKEFILKICAINYSFWFYLLKEEILSYR